MVVAATVPNAALAMKGGVPSAEPWVVRVLGTLEGDTVRCTGAAINEQIVITATHCGALAVEFADHTATLYGAYPIVGTDISVLVLTAAHPLSAYATVRRGTAAASGLYPVGTQGVTYGLDLANPHVQMRVTMQLKMVGPTPEGTEVFVMHKADGAMEEGDSGGPLIINGELVGVMREIGTHQGAEANAFHSITPALEAIATLNTQRKARAFLGAEL
jgi:hypothetical protein